MNPDYNYSYAYEKAYDNLHERYEDVRDEEETCQTCIGDGIEQWSSCCGAKVVHDMCLDCLEPCETVTEKCSSCDGEGTIIKS